MIRKINKKRFKARGSTLLIEHHRSQAGFTLVELLISSILTLLVLGAIYSVYQMQIHTVKAQERRLEAQEYARAVLDLMVREIRNAAYNPLGATGGANCAGGGVGVPSVVTATATSFRFTYDANADGDCDDTSEDVTYGWDTTSCAAGLGNITRDDGTGAVWLTDCNVSVFALSYYQQDGTVIAPPVTGATLANIYRVLITLTVQSTNPDGNYGGGQLNASMNSNAELRNRGL